MYRCRVRVMASLGMMASLLAVSPTAAYGNEASDRAAWFREAKFGMFVHWGPFAVHSSDPNSTFDYFAMKDDASAREAFRAYAEQFNPKSFDAARWMETAKAGGMKYVIFTSRHHDGYCMFDSAWTDFDAMDMPPKRDYVRDLVAAARKAGLKIGFYYSLLDWRHPDYVGNFPAFVNGYLFGQVRELCANYGPIDCVWFDGEWDHPAEAWRAADLVGLVRELQPEALVNDRLGKGERGVTALSDFYTREQPSEMDSAMPFEHQRPHVWEACMTIGDYWQYSIKDTKLKSVRELIRVLVDIVSRGGNLLLNVGPTPDGVIPAPLVERVAAIGSWLATNGEGIYGTSGSPFGPLPGYWCTAKENRVYVHLQAHPGKPVQLPHLKNDIRKVWFLKGRAEVAFDNSQKSFTLPDSLPDPDMTSIAVELDGTPRIGS